MHLYVNYANSLTNKTNKLYSHQSLPYLSEFIFTFMCFINLNLPLTDFDRWNDFLLKKLTKIWYIFFGVCYQSTVFDNFKDKCKSM